MYIYIYYVCEAAKAGHWLCLKNLHLIVHWVPQLEKEISVCIYVYIYIVLYMCIYVYIYIYIYYVREAAKAGHWLYLKNLHLIVH